MAFSHGVLEKERASMVAGVIGKPTLYICIG